MRAVLTRVAALCALALVLAGCSGGSGDADAVRAAVTGYLQDWAAGDYAAAGALTDDPPTTVALLTAAGTAVGVPGPTGRPGAPTLAEGRATVPVRLDWAVPALPVWSYDITVTVVRTDTGDWALHVDTTTVHPDLAAGQQLVLTRTLPERATITDAAGSALFAPTPIVNVGIDSTKVTDLPSLTATLATVLDVDAADLTAAVQAAPAGQFVPVVTLRRSDYDAVRAQIFDLPGTVFTEGTRDLAPSSQFARAVLGRVGPVTGEIVAEAPDVLTAGDEAGLSGLERVYQTQLTGTPGFTVSAEVGGQVVGDLGGVPPVPGTPVATTLDSAVQTAADAATATMTLPSYVVAIRPSTGAILAVSANAPADANNALTGQFPAGSTFKIITAAAALEAGGVTPDTTVPCPASTTISGKEFENEDRFDLGDVSLRTAFAESCNSTFTALGAGLPATALPEAAAQFGVGTGWTLPVDVFGGSIPEPADEVTQAADSIGQGEVLVSPFAMALVAATAEAGRTPVPVLVPAAAAAGSAPDGPPGGVLDQLRPMMRAVVTDGTASALADLPGEIAGKTGTAEYGTGSPPPAHAWFVGYRGDLAFAVFVEGGQSSGTTAVPLAGTFLAGLPA